jgi:uncharacterized protein
MFMSNHPHTISENAQVDVSQMSLRERLKADLKSALKARQLPVVTVLRSALSEIDNAEAVELDASMVSVVGRLNDVPRKVLTEDQIRDILQVEANEIQGSLVEYQRLGKHEEAKKLHVEWEVLARYL